MGSNSAAAETAESRQRLADRLLVARIREVLAARGVPDMGLEIGAENGIVAHVHTFHDLDPGRHRAATLRRAFALTKREPADRQAGESGPDHKDHHPAPGLRLLVQGRIVHS